ncbi:CDP-glycerol glycerophosphotransferase family protein [Salipiger sp. IMCC34102]|uniref:CDP-glycerol glycerophosphotransferase family protein n=1 Tax=Salipiger sp. IMCC34102 TaxID=2510647 RepID=UPI0013ED11BD|nr:CDP-glycerol glycerophosphotransferase family protein [Salipiger sp. IMCC34102]
MLISKSASMLRNRIKGVASTFRRRARLGFQQVTGTAPAVARSVITKTQLRDGKLVVSGWIVLNHTPTEVSFIVRKFREETISEKFPIEISKPLKRGFSNKIARLLRLTRHDFEVVLDFPWADVPSSIYGTGISVDDRVTTINTMSNALGIFSDDTAGRTYCVFIESSVRVLRIEMYHFGSHVVEDLRARSLAPRSDRIGVVLGEYTNIARDNGRALFEYLHSHADADVDASYIVEPNNLDDYDVNQPGVLPFGSREHLERCLDAHVCAFTHHRNYVYPAIIEMISPERYNSTRTLFLQHGITAMKKSVARHYSKNRVDYSAISVCSQLEREIFRNHFSYDSSSVFVTGFPRYDTLFRKAKSAEADPDQVLFFPTWRAGLEKMTTEEVFDNEFFVRWQQAMKGVSDMGLRSVLILHPMLHRHRALFEDHVDEIRSTTTFQDTLLQSSCLITDYSSVSFDALFVKKPVFLFQFDQESYGLREEAFIDVESQLPGHVSLSLDPLLQDVSASRAGNWRFKLQRQRDTYFDAEDDQNSARTLDLIKALAMTN